MTEPTTPVGVPTCYRHPDRETYISCQRCGRSICPDCMRDAAVGFQCPHCVAEGAKSTRSGLATYGGRRSSDPTLTSKVLIGVNAAVFLAVLATGAGSSWLAARLYLTPLGRCWDADFTGYFPRATNAAVCATGPGATWVPGVADGAPWQLLTSAFLHEQVWHIGFNMLALWVLGPQLEAALGRVRFLALYLLSALAGSTSVYWLAPETSATLGASGAVFGLMGGLLVLAFKVRGNVSQILVWIGINVAITVVGRGFISWQGHLGGLVGGVLIAAVIVYAPRSRRTPVQVAGLAALAAVLVALVVARTLALA
ncbi:rhomboid family intramembrane serine protease [uncultured Nocardioides sp.]|uniref:rhomboid family intramembrane serine protease n=1 Tax=uncultured Nocardioides sp. TaxID=198441 RepID=UPI0025DBE564|nr:rhomboid family intramembrane serine protease [uncultured Nocardioides sp.]